MNMNPESLGDDTCRIAQILNGRRAITGDTALRLAHFFGTLAGVLVESAKPV